MNADPHAARNDANPAGGSGPVSRIHRRPRDGTIAVAVALVSLLFHLLYFRHGVVNMVDLGVACGDAERILEGQIPGRDFFEPYGPGRFYLTALAFLVAGKSLLTFSSLCLILLGLKDAMIFLAARCLVSRPAALFVAALSIMVHGPLHKVFLMLAGMMILLPAFRLIERPGFGAAFWLGLGIGLAGLLRYDVGAAGVIMAIPLLILLPCAARSDPGFLRMLKGFLLGLVLIVGPAVLFLLAGSDIPSFVGNHLDRIQSLEQANAGIPGLFDLPFSKEPQEYMLGYLILFLGAAWLITAAMAIRFFRGSGEERQKALVLMVLLIMALLLFNQVRLGAKFSRLSQVAPPFFMILAFLLQAAFNALGKHPKVKGLRWVCPIAALALFFFFGGYIWAFQGSQSQDSFAVLKLREHYLDHPRGGCYFPLKKGREIEEVVRYIEGAVKPDEPIFTGPTCPLFHFLTGRPNPTPFTDFTFYYFSDKNQREVIDRIEKARVRYIVEWPRELTGFLFERSAPILRNHLHACFSVERSVGRFDIRKRRR